MGTMRWRVRSKDIRIDRPLIVGVLNVTPDSFSDGGRYNSLDAAVSRATQMVSEGADAIDVGGESTRPQGAMAVSADEEIDRVIPVIRQLRTSLPDVLLSVDTTKSAVATAAINAGADIINDVSGLRLDARLGEIVASRSVGVVLMHSRGGVSEMGTYRHATYGDDIVGEVIRELEASVATAVNHGVDRAAIVIDPGVGFAKRSEHSLEMLAGLPRLMALGFPILVGVSRKRFVGELSGVERASDRVAGTVGANVAALMNGARLFRVHDVAPNREALDVAWGVVKAGLNRDALGARPVDPVDSRFPIPDSP
jgi:dihydropteroate synthase